MSHYQIESMRSHIKIFFDWSDGWVIIMNRNRN